MAVRRLGKIVMATSPRTLEIQTGKYKGRKVKLTSSEVIVGRGEDAQVRISSAEVSREHCVLVACDDGVLVRDLGSSNGTFVDGRPITGEKLLAPGGTLTIGPLTFLLLGAPPSNPALSTDIAISGKSGTGENLSDDDIASWLSDDEIPIPGNVSSDTTVVKGRQDPPASPPPAQPKPVIDRPTPSPTLRRREFKSVAEEAQDIIRRHFEMQAESES